MNDTAMNGMNDMDKGPCGNAGNAKSHRMKRAIHGADPAEE